MHRSADRPPIPAAANSRRPRPLFQFHRTAPPRRGGGEFSPSAVRPRHSPHIPAASQSAWTPPAFPCIPTYQTAATLFRLQTAPRPTPGTVPFFPRRWDRGTRNSRWVGRVPLTPPGCGGPPLPLRLQPRLAPQFAGGVSLPIPTAGGFHRRSTPQREFPSNQTPPPPHHRHKPSPAGSSIDFPKSPWPADMPLAAVLPAADSPPPARIPDSEPPHFFAPSIDECSPAAVPAPAALSPLPYAPGWQPRPSNLPLCPAEIDREYTARNTAPPPKWPRRKFSNDDAARTAPAIPKGFPPLGLAWAPESAPVGTAAPMPRPFRCISDIPQWL